MKKAAILLAHGFEEIETITVLDILRRAEVQAELCSIEGKEVEGAHGVTVRADVLLKDVKLEDYDAIITPGGLPGATNLRDDQRVVEAIKGHFDQEGKWIGSIFPPSSLLEQGLAAPFVVLATHRWQKRYNTKNM